MRFRLGLSCVVLVRIRDFFVDIIRIMMFLHAVCMYYELLRFEFIQKKSGIQTLSGIGAKKNLECSLRFFNLFPWLVLGLASGHEPGGCGSRFFGCWSEFS